VFRPYLRVLRIDGAWSPTLAGFLGALPIGMLNLAVLLLVEANTGSFAGAGVATGAFSLGNAIGLVVQGRLIDRHGQTAVLVSTAVLCPTALVLLVISTTPHGPLELVWALAAMAGASIPATTTSMRVLWPVLAPDPLLRATAYALLATQFQIAMVTGPLVVSALLLTAGPSAAVLVSAALAASSGLLFAAAPASRAWRPISQAPRHPRFPIGRLAVPGRAGMRTILIGCLGAGLASGTLTVAVPAVAAAHRSVALAGLLFAAFSAGELVSGLGYGARSWRVPTPRRLVIGQAGIATGAAALTLLTGHPSWMLPVMFLIGAFTAPVSIANSALLDDLAPTGRLTRSYTTMVSAGLIGSAAGSAAGGTLVRATGYRPVFLVASGAMAAVALWTVLRDQTLTAR
jgi:MFS family permease